MLLATATVTMSAFLSGIFWLAALHKWRDGDGFREALADYPLIPSSLIGLLVPSLIVLEIGLAIGLLVPVVTAMVGLIAALVLGVYTLVLAAGLVQGDRMQDCGCGGLVGRQPPGGWMLGRNILLITMAITVSQNPHPTLATFYLVVPMALFMLGFYFAVEQLMSNHTRMTSLRGG